MNRVSLLILALGCVMVTTAPACAQRGRGEPDARRYGWLGSLEEGKQQARRSGKAIMAVVRCVP